MENFMTECPESIATAILAHARAVRVSIAAGDAHAADPGSARASSAYEAAHAARSRTLARVDMAVLDAVGGGWAP